ncbi:MAG: DUF6365 family protein [Deltaproteobacteria bacterium]|nr:DUF6365 family protein [Deltaproteobacteria bacterium]
MTTHLFVAPGAAAFGEVLLGLRLARALHDRGDRVLFLAPRAFEVLLAPYPFAHGHSDAIAQVLDRALPDIVRDRRADTVTLLDLAVTLVACQAYRLDPGFLARLGVPVIALDIFDVGTGGGRRYDMGEVAIELGAVPDAPLRRIVPVPFARPTTAAAYGVLGDGDVPTDEDRQRTRQGLGIGADEPLLVLVTAAFQGRGLSPFQVRLVDAMPALLAAQVAALGPIRVVHVGPRALAGMGPRYRHLGQVAPAEFRRLIAAADVLYTLNLSATSVVTALEVDTPVVAAISSRRGPPDAAAHDSATVAAALARLGPLYPFRVFPLGLHDFMAPVLVDNPYADAVTQVELFDEHASVATLRALLFDGDARQAARARAARYRDQIRALPGAPLEVYSDQWTSVDRSTDARGTGSIDS